MKRYLTMYEKRFIYNNLLKKGYSPKQARDELALLVENAKDFNKQEKEEKKQERQDKNKYFKKGFADLCEQQNKKW